MKPHVHAELIKKWADGAVIEVYRAYGCGWEYIETPTWRAQLRYRVKPKSDIVMYSHIDANKGAPCILINSLNKWLDEEESSHPLLPNVKMTIDGETGELKSIALV